MYASYGSDDNRKFPVVLYQDVFMFPNAFDGSVCEECPCA